ncbi:hypothetical protein [Streptomyces roseolilacinus]|uniref:hypothetical protein n=1 Tax=Streptomyces roseolilacinus TaxID=66904 RepID=UPI00381CC9F9
MSKRRIAPATGIVHHSVIKPLGAAYEAPAPDFSGTEPAVSRVRLEPGTEEERQATVAVMGGADWAARVRALADRGLPKPGFTTVALTYVGSGATAPVYRQGTIGAAKEHLEQTARVRELYGWGVAGVEYDRPVETDVPWPTARWTGGGRADELRTGPLLPPPPHRSRRPAGSPRHHRPTPFGPPVSRGGVGRAPPGLSWAGQAGERSVRRRRRRRGRGGPFDIGNDLLQGVRCRRSSFRPEPSTTRTPAATGRCWCSATACR